MDNPVQASQPQSNQTPLSPTQASVAKPVSWPKIILTVLVIAIAVGLLGGGLWYFVLNKSSDTVDTTPIKVSTPSAKKATESSKKATSSTTKDEISNWETDVENFMGLKFSLKYPAKFTIYRSHNADAVYTTDEGSEKFYVVTNRSSLITNYENGDVSLSVYVEDNPVLAQGIKYVDAEFAGVEAKMGEGESQGGGKVEYYTNNQPSAKGKYVTFSCLFYPSTDLDLKKICDLMASNFKFL
ncbi:MAG: hypothetical protein WD231_01855 [Candidatus Woykebacteria bacterium]